MNIKNISFFMILFIVSGSGTVFAKDNKDIIHENIMSLFPNGKPYDNSGESLAHYPDMKVGTGVQAEKILRGEYLVKIGDCVACHTVKGGKPFAGGLGFDTPFGLIYSPNITPDKKTGIGKWSIAQFKKAVTQGIKDKHTYLYPAFPYIYYNIITNQDLEDIYAYLQAIPAVEARKPKNKMMFSFNWRMLQLGWRILFFDFQKKDSYRYNPKHNDSWNRGAYLVLGLGHCDMCHTPMYHVISDNLALGAPIRHRHLTGAYISGFYAPNITQLLIKDLSFSEFQQIFWQNKLPQGGQLQGPMYQVNHDSLQYLKLEDLRAIDSYLSTVKSTTPAKPTTSGKESGKIIYDHYCKTCHEAGRGPIEGAPALGDEGKWEIFKNLGMDTLLWYAMNGINGMPIKGTCTDCTAEEIRETIKYMLDNSIPSKSEAIVQPTLADGKRIYQHHCATCHNSHVKLASKTLIDKGMDNLILSTWNGKGQMPARGGCQQCNLADIKAAVKYMMDESVPEGDYRLW